MIKVQNMALPVQFGENELRAAAAKKLRVPADRIEAIDRGRRGVHDEGGALVSERLDGKIEIDPMITHTMPLDDINKGFDLMHSGESIRSVVLY